MPKDDTLPSWSDKVRQEEARKWRMEVLETPRKLGRDLGKTAAQIWLYADLPCDIIAASFRLTLKYYCRKHKILLYDIAKLQDLAANDFTKISDKYLDPKRNPKKRNLGIGFFVLRLWTDAICKLEADATTSDLFKSSDYPYDYGPYYYLEMLSLTCQTNGDVDGAINILKSADGQIEPWTKVILAELYASRGDYRSELELYLEMSNQVAKRTWWFRQLLAKAYVNNGKQEAAERLYQPSVNSEESMVRTENVADGDVTTDTQVPSASSLGQEIRSKQINLGDALCVILFNRDVPRRFDVSLVRTFEHTTDIQCFQFSPDGNFIAVVCVESVAILDCQTGNKVAVIHEEDTNLVTTPAVQICFTPDGRHLVGLTPSRIKIWDIETGDTRIVNVDLEKGRIRVISEDGTMLVTSSDDGVRKVWAVSLRRHPSIQQQTLLLGEFKVDVFAISSDKKFVAGGGPHGKVVVWETETGAVVLDSEICEEMVSNLKFSFKGDRLLVGSFSGTVRLLEFATAKDQKDRDPDLRAHSSNPVRTFPPSALHNEWAFSLCWSGDDKYVLAAGYSNGSICVWNNNLVPEFVLGRSHNNYGIGILDRFLNSV